MFVTMKGGSFILTLFSNIGKTIKLELELTKIIEKDDIIYCPLKKRIE